MDSVPGLIISGNEKSIFTSKGNKLRVWGVQGFDGINTYKNFCKTAERLLDPKDVITITNKVIKSTLNGRPGPSWLEIPLNIQNQIINYKTLSAQIKRVKKFLNKKKTISKTIEKSFEIVRFKKRPLIIFGNGCRNIDKKKKNY